MSNRSVTVQRLGGKGRGVVALRAFALGDRVLRAEPAEVSAERTTHTIQWDWHVHFVPAEPATYLNHCCDPNLNVRSSAEGGYDFLARRAIAAGDEVTFDYGTTEYEIVTEGPCLCGAAACTGRMLGFKDWSPERKARYGVFVADYLKTSVRSGRSGPTYE